jgi:DNA polymerase-4
MADGVAARLRAAGVRGATVTVKVRDSSFTTITRQRTLPTPTDLTEPIWQTALELARPEVVGKRIRLLGVTVSGLGSPEQMGLFAEADDRRRRAIEAADSIRRRYGNRAVTRARLLRSGMPAPFERSPMTAVERRVGVTDPAEERSPVRDSGPVTAPDDDLPEGA